MKGKRKKYFFIASLMLAAIVCWLLFSQLRRVSEIRTVQAGIGQESASVIITWTHDRFIGVHPFPMGGGNWDYRTQVTLTSGMQFSFHTKLRPRAIWKLGDSLYVACADTGYWFLGKITESGLVVETAAQALPEGEKPWNLEPPQTHTDWQRDFDRWRKSRP